jgi:hypothetical protein
MSDTSQGPGWWLASDGKWYPPEAWTGPPRQSDAPAAATPSYPSGPPAGYPSGVPYPGSAGGQPYGGQPYGYQPYGAMPYAGHRPTNGMAIASLICSCVGIILLGIPCVLGVIFGFIARSQIRRGNNVQQGSGLALAGIIVGFVVIGLVILGAIVLATHPCTTSGGITTCNN